MKFAVTWSEPKKFEDGNFRLAVTGVYLIGYRDTETNERYLIYIGQGDVGDRLSDHYQNNRRIGSKLKPDGRVGYYRYAKCEDENGRLDIELGLYRKHGGSEKLCNEIEPPGSGRYQIIEVEETFP